MSEDNNLIAVKVLDREYAIRCPRQEEASLQEAARYLDDQMRVVRQSGTITSTDRVAIVTALNLTHELFQLENKKMNTLMRLEIASKIYKIKLKISWPRKKKLRYNCFCTLCDSADGECI